jgi:hypothetical protein
MKLYNRMSDALEVLLTGDGGVTTVSVIVPPGTHSILSGLSVAHAPLGVHVLEDEPVVAPASPPTTKEKEPK